MQQNFYDFNSDLAITTAKTKKSHSETKNRAFQPKLAFLAIELQKQTRHKWLNNQFIAFSLGNVHRLKDKHGSHVHCHIPYLT